MSAECPECERPVRPVAAPVVVNENPESGEIISAYELNDWRPTANPEEPGLVSVAFFCPICRHVFTAETPDASWAWLDWDGLPVVVSNSALLTLGID